MPLGDRASLCLAVALGLPLPRRRAEGPRRRASAGGDRGRGSRRPRRLDRPRRQHRHGRGAAAAEAPDERGPTASTSRGTIPEALKSFEGRPGCVPTIRGPASTSATPCTRTASSTRRRRIFRALGADAQSPLAAAARFNLGQRALREEGLPGRGPAPIATRCACARTTRTRDATSRWRCARCSSSKQQQQTPADKTAGDVRSRSRQPTAEPDAAAATGAAPAAADASRRRSSSASSRRRGCRASAPCSSSTPSSRTRRSEQKKLMAEKQARKKGGQGLVEARALPGSSRLPASAARARRAPPPSFSRPQRGRRAAGSASRTRSSSRSRSRARDRPTSRCPRSTNLRVVAARSVRRRSRS